MNMDHTQYVTRIKKFWRQLYAALRRPVPMPKVVETRKFSVNKPVLGGILGVCMILFAFYLTWAPFQFMQNTEVIIPEGSSLQDVAYILRANDIIRSPLLFQIAVHLGGGERGLQAGAYMFPDKLSVFEIARAVVTGHYQVPPTRITIFEGMRVEQIADILEHEHGIDKQHFLEIAEPYEGYLFPETYFIPEAYTEEDILALMLDTFASQFDSVQDEVEASELSPQEVVILASIIEREARSEESMKLVAGILHKRLDMGLPLQVDATFNYILGKTSAELTLDDLAVDSPFNTYKNTGLPPSPISNPGMQSIEAVLHPIESDYLYYLTDINGTFHYAKTFEEHKRNKALYL